MFAGGAEHDRVLNTMVSRGGRVVLLWEEEATRERGTTVGYGGGVVRYCRDCEQEYKR